MSARSQRGTVCLLGFVSFAALSSRSPNTSITLLSEVDALQLNQRGPSSWVSGRIPQLLVELLSMDATVNGSHAFIVSGSVIGQD